MKRKCTVKSAAAPLRDEMSGTQTNTLWPHALGSYFSILKNDFCLSLSVFERKSGGYVYSVIAGIDSIIVCLQLQSITQSVTNALLWSDGWARFVTGE